MKKISTKDFLFFLAFSFTWLSLSAQNARIQVVHNAANAPAVDIFVGATKLFAGVPFRAASPFSDAPAGVPLQVRIKAASASNDTSNPAFFRQYVLESGKGYYLIANGNLALPGGTYAANPDAIPTNFDVTVIPDARETALVAGNVDLRIFHGVTDAPTVDIKAQGVATLVEDASFRAASAYIPVPAGTYTVQIAPASGTPNILAYSAGVSALAGQTVLVLASGYFNPSANTTNGNAGPAFGIWAFTTSGQAIQLPTATSRVQIVHNCANAPAVDIFVNGGKAIPALEFRKATPFVDLNAGVPLTVAIKGASAGADTSNPAFKQVYELAGGERYTIVATGLLSTTGYAPNPEGRSVNFDLTILPDAKEVSGLPGSSEVRVLHAATDAPKVDVRIQGGATVVDNAGFRDFTNYLPGGNQDLVLEITDSTSSAVVGAFTAPLSVFADSALVVMASGFLTPSANQNGPAFGLLAVTAKGQAIMLPVFTRSKAGINLATTISIFPNPSTSSFQIRLSESTEIRSAGAVTSTGKIIPLQIRPDGEFLTIEHNLPAGNYQLQLIEKRGETIYKRFSVH